MKKAIFIFIFLVNLAIIFYFWLDRSGSLLMSGQTGFFIALGRISGLLAVYFILWQLILIGRVKFLEQSFGFDRLAIWHHFNGLFAWSFILLHPLFLIIGHSQANEVGLFSQALDFLLNWDDLVNAYLAFTLFLVIIILSLGAIQKKLKYEVWYFIHLFTYLGIIWAFGHQLELGTDLKNLTFSGYWYVLYVAAVGPLVYFRLLKPLYLFYRHRFQVTRIETENEQIISVYIKGQNLKEFNWRGGQFAIFRFLNKKLFWEAHPFSFSSIFDGEQLRVTIKNLGDYSGSLRMKLQAGDYVMIDGPHGIFTTKRTKNNKIALFAGGIGITPILALIKDNFKQKEISLFYAATKENELMFKDELASLQALALGKLKINYIVSQSDSWLGEKGRIDEEKIKRLLPNFLEFDFFLCGPPLMIKSVRKILKSLNIKARKIYYEKFSLS